jgi:hypothetical protein
MKKIEDILIMIDRIRSHLKCHQDLKDSDREFFVQELNLLEELIKKVRDEIDQI